ncbi:MAG TPA: hypothetical protein VG756_06770 [Pseudonocardiaceae bacterium]|jgi:hypothetical protein|nr:hypothetical protein [Pseudonocardiaceae bacterium]
MSTGATYRPGRHTQVVLRPIGSALPLGFLALFVGSLLLSAIQLHWTPVAQTHEIAIGVLCFVVPLQALGTVFGLLARDPVCATGLGVLGGTWLAAGLLLLLGAPGVPSPGLGVLLVAAAAALLVPTGTAAAGKVLAAIVIGGAAARFAISGVYQLSGSAAGQQAAGIAGVVVAGLAGYGALAFELESAFGRTILPTFRHHQGRLAMSGRLADQVAGITHEAGVREEL